MVNNATLGVRVGAPREAPELVRRPREQGKNMRKKAFCGFQRKGQQDRVNRLRIG